jgi:hypothetical protein
MLTLEESAEPRRFGMVASPRDGQWRFEGWGHPHGKEPARMPIALFAPQGDSTGGGIEELQGFR